MNISLDLDKETADRIAREASRAGQDVPSFFKNFVTRSFSDEATSRRLVGEILGPFRAEIEQTGVTENQLDTLFAEAREQAWASRHRTEE